MNFNLQKNCNTKLTSMALFLSIFEGPYVFSVHTFDLCLIVFYLLLPAGARSLIF